MTEFDDGSDEFFEKHIRGKARVGPSDEERARRKEEERLRKEREQETPEQREDRRKKERAVFEAQQERMRAEARARHAEYRRTMTVIDVSKMSREELIDTVAGVFVGELEKHGSWKESDLSEIGSEPYKPCYRTTCLLLSPSIFREQFMGDGLFTREEAEQMLRKAHPWFDHMFDHNRGCFDYLWDDTAELYPGGEDLP